MFVYASNLGVLFSTFAGFALLFCIKVVAEGEVVLPKALNVKPSARLKRRTALFASATALTDLDVSGWTVFREDGATVDVAAQIKLADDGKTVWALPNSGTTVFIR